MIRYGTALNGSFRARRLVGNSLGLEMGVGKTAVYPLRI
jgi:hypothetical protein